MRRSSSQPLKKPLGVKTKISQELTKYWNKEIKINERPQDTNIRIQNVYEISFIVNVTIFSSFEHLIHNSSTFQTLNHL